MTSSASFGQWTRGFPMRSYLVVANQTLGGEHLIAKVRERMAAGPCCFHVVVPATPPSDHAWTEGEARALAQSRLDAAVARFRELGADVDGEVGDQNPLLAIGDALRGKRFDEIMLSTLSPGASRWLKLDLPRRAADRFGIPLTHVIGAPEPGAKQSKDSPPPVSDGRDKARRPRGQEG
jgi:GABA permease